MADTRSALSATMSAVGARAMAVIRPTDEPFAELSVGNCGKVLCCGWGMTAD